MPAASAHRLCHNQGMSHLTCCEGKGKTKAPTDPKNAGEAKATNGGRTKTASGPLPKPF